MVITNYDKAEKKLFSEPIIVKPNEVKYAINAAFLRFNCSNAAESYRELMVSFFPMLPLIEKEVQIYEADYILYAHPYARLEDMSPSVLKQLHEIDKIRKPGAEIIIVGKAANIELLLAGSISNITFYESHYAEALGKRFEINIKDQAFVFDSSCGWLNIWPVNGCLKKCKFCRRTYMNIPFESISLEEIKQELDTIRRNCPSLLKYICLRAENLTEYGIDIYGKAMLSDLIKLIASYDEVKCIDLFPIGLALSEITDELLDTICSIKKIGPSIAINLEVGSNRLLTLTGKGHTREREIHVFKEIRKAHPNINISTSIMIGFPTETLTDIYELADLINQTDPNHIFCNFVEIAPKCLLADMPRLNNSLREYHLEILLKLLKEQRKKHKVTISYPQTFKKGKRLTYRFNKECLEEWENYSLLIIPRKYLTIEPKI